MWVSAQVGGSPYYGDQKILYTFVQDDWRIRPNVTLNLGLNHSYQEVPKGREPAGSERDLLQFRD